MQMMKWSALALAVAAGTSQVAFASAQSESKGFIEDSKLDVFSRALYMNRASAMVRKATPPPMAAAKATLKKPAWAFAYCSSPASLKALLASVLMHTR